MLFLFLHLGPCAKEEEVLCQPSLSLSLCPGHSLGTDHSYGGHINVEIQNKGGRGDHCGHYFSWLCSRSEYIVLNHVLMGHPHNCDHSSDCDQSGSPSHNCAWTWLFEWYHLGCVLPKQSGYGRSHCDKNCRRA